MRPVVALLPCKIALDDPDPRSNVQGSASGGLWPKTRRHTGMEQRRARRLQSGTHRTVGHPVRLMPIRSGNLPPQVELIHRLDLVLKSTLVEHRPLPISRSSKPTDSALHGDKRTTLRRESLRLKRGRDHMAASPTPKHIRERTESVPWARWHPLYHGNLARLAIRILGPMCEHICERDCAFAFKSR